MVNRGDAMNKKNIIFFLCFILIVFFISGCASSGKKISQNKIFELQYKPVSGNVYTYQGLRFEITCPLRTRGKNSYFYALKRRPFPLESPEKYLLFDLSIHNPRQLNVRIPRETIALEGSSGKEYKPLDSIRPDTNRTRFLLRNISSLKTSPFIYAILVFEDVPETETELNLRFQIEVEDMIDNHYVLFEKQKTDPQLVHQWDEKSKKVIERERLIKKYTNEDGYIKPSDLNKIQK